MPKQIIILLGIWLTLPQLFAQPERQYPHPKLAQEIKAYTSENIIPVVKAQRVKLNTILTSDEQAEMELIRQEMQKLHEERRERHFRRRQGENEAHLAPLSDSARTELSAARKAHRKLMTQIWEIADAHEDDMDQLLEELHLHTKELESDIRQLFEQHRDTALLAVSPEGLVNPPHTFQYGFRREEGPRARLRELLLPIRFLLMDPDKELEPFRKEPEEMLLNYPNPAQSNNTISFRVDRPGRVQVLLRNDQGKQVRTVIDKILQEGKYEENVDLSQLAPGMYFYQIITSQGVQTHQLKIKEE